jgi:hypothetical protein
MNIRASLATLFIFLWPAGAAIGQPVQYVIHISVDGGGSSYIQTLINNNALPNFNRLVTGGASTFNARDDYDYTVTLPNHVTQVTGRGVEGVDGHNWIDNEDPEADQTIHGNKGSYVAGVFDVAHDNGLRTGMYASKTKFSLFDASYSAVNGASDLTGVDNGRGKLDSYVCDENTSTLTDSLITAMQADPFNYVFVHYADPDFAGHNSGWGSEDYNNAMIAVDGYLGRIFDMVASDATFTGKTAIVLTADHGGNDYDHSDPTDPLDYTIPFGVWGPGVTAGADLYALNTVSRLDPGTDAPLYSDAVQPIRNGDAPNLELQLLGLPSVPGSTINVAQNLAVPEPASLGLLVMGLASLFAFKLFAGKQK